MGELSIHERAGEVWFSVRVHPRASRDAFTGVHDGALRVSLTAPPVDGEANQALLAFVARALRVARRDVRVVQGESGRTKVLAVRGVTVAAVAALANAGRRG